MHYHANMAINPVKLSLDLTLNEAKVEKLRVRVVLLDIFAKNLPMLSWGFVFGFWCQFHQMQRFTSLV